MTDLDFALSQISCIRAQLVKNTRFRGLAPSTEMLTSVLVLVVAAIQSGTRPGLTSDLVGFVQLWTSVFLGIASVAAITTYRRARRIHGKEAIHLMAAGFQRIIPFGAAGVMISWTLYQFSPESLWLLPGTWQILIGLLGFSVAAIMPKGTTLVAAWYLLCGASVMALAAQSHSLSPWMMGVPLGIGHFLLAVVFSRVRIDGDFSDI